MLPEKQEKLSDKISSVHWILLVLIGIGLFFIVKNTKISNTGSDSRGTLLVSQQILKNGTITLDAYISEFKNYDYQIRKKLNNNHYYYYFPLGSSISSLPFVFIAHYVFDLDMANLQDDHRVQKVIAGFLAVFIFLLCFSIANRYLSINESIILSVLFWGGTSFASTLGTALWSHNFAILFSLAAIYLILRITKQNSKILASLIAVFLFLAYLSRPTLSLLSIALVIYTFLKDKKLVFAIAGLEAILLGSFILFSWHEFGQWLPDYYIPKRLSNPNYWTAFYGNLLSPARGIFVFSPFLFVFFLRPKKTITILRKNYLSMIFLGWVILHLITISKFPHWWGGHSFGPRLMSDVLPGIFFLLVQLVVVLKEEQDSLRKKFTLLALSLLFLGAVFIHSYQGLFNLYTQSWNTTFDIDKKPKYLFDWENPQFLHNEKREVKRKLSRLRPIICNFPFVFGKPNNRSSLTKPINHYFIFAGISLKEFWGRWSKGEEVKIFFKDNLPLLPITNIKLRLRGYVVKQKTTQIAKLYLNDVAIGEISFSINGPNEKDFIFSLPDGIYKSGMNTLKFLIDNPESPSSLGIDNDERKIGIGFISMEFGSDKKIKKRLYPN